MGSIIEWYDLSLYGLMIIEFSNTFFPVSVHSRSLDIIYASFAISFMLRPIGGLIFGYIGDIKGYVYSINLSFFLLHW